MKDPITPAHVYILKEAITYAEGSVVSKIITKNKSGNTTLFAFDKGQGLSEHTAPFDAMAVIVDGHCKITIGGEDFELQEGLSRRTSAPNHRVCCQPCLQGNKILPDQVHELAHKPSGNHDSKRHQRRS